MPPYSRTATPEHTFFDAKGATGAGTALNVKSYRHIVVSVATDGAGDAALTLKCQGAISAAAPTWTTGPVVANMWEYVGMNDLNDGTLTAGDTGFVVSVADDYKLYEINVDGLEWVNFRVTAYTTNGEVTVKGVRYSN